MKLCCLISNLKFWIDVDKDVKIKCCFLSCKIVCYLCKNMKLIIGFNGN